MSYILDALQKSEQKRQRDSVPDLQTVHDSEPPKKRKRLLWPSLLVAALMINAVLLALFLPARRNDNSLTVSPAAENEAPAASRLPIADKMMSAETAGRELFPKGDTGDVNTVAEFIPAVIQTERPMATETYPAKTHVAQRSMVQEPSSLGLVTTDNVSLANRPVSLNHTDDMQEKMPPDQEDTITSSLVPEPLADDTEFEGERPAVELPRPETGKKPEKAIPLLASLPRSLRQSIPELAISFHVYTQKPATRLVSINGRIAREGQEVAPELTLVEITAAGVVLNYKGNRFRLEVF